MLLIAEIFEDARHYDNCETDLIHLQPTAPHPLSIPLPDTPNGITIILPKIAE